MRIVAFVLATLVVALVAPVDAGSASQTFPVTLDRAWSIAGKVLKVLGWDLDKVDRSIGWITTRRERILWMDSDEPVATPDQAVEREVLAAIGRSF